MGREYVDGVPFILGNMGGNNNCNDGFNGMNGIWSLAILALIFGGGNWFGNRGNVNAGVNTAMAARAATTEDLANGFAQNNIQRGVQGISQGICDSTYAINNSIKDLGSGLKDIITQSNFGIQNSLNNISHQMSDCCCDIKSQIKDVIINANENNCNTLRAIENLGCKIDGIVPALEAARAARELHEKELEILALKGQLSQDSQTKTIIAALQGKAVA